MIRFKPEVRIRYLDERLALVLREASLWSLFSRVDVEVNSIDDGARPQNARTLHGRSLAVDLDTVGDKRADGGALAEHLRCSLPQPYDVVDEGDHVHVEYDTRRPRPRAEPRA